uniref:Uncharacterized protein n=1 Tax=Magallana gigas TaxID=29159 RepID=K1RMA6_MAGGI
MNNKFTGGGPPPRPLSAIAETVSNVVGQHNACLSGIDGGIDSSMLQILGDSELLGLGIHVIEGPPDIEPHIISTGTTQDTAATITSPPPARTAASQQTPAIIIAYLSKVSFSKQLSVPNSVIDILANLYIQPITIILLTVIQVTIIQGAWDLPVLANVMQDAASNNNLTCLVWRLIESFIITSVG